MKAVYRSVWMFLFVSTSLFLNAQSYLDFDQSVTNSQYRTVSSDSVTFEYVLSKVGQNAPDYYNNQASIQAKSELQVDKALQGFLDTDFMKYYRHSKFRMEGAVQSFKEMQRQFSAREVADVKIAYNMVADRYNRLLQEIKGDFLDKKKLKNVIAAYPEYYVQGLNGKLKELDAYANQNFYQKVAELTGEEIDGAIPILLILELVNVAGKLTNYFAQVSYNRRKITNDYMNANFIQPNQFTPWDRIQQLRGGQYGGYGGYDDYGGGGYDDYNNGGGYDDFNNGGEFQEEFQDESFDPSFDQNQAEIERAQADQLSNPFLIKKDSTASKNTKGKNKIKHQN